MFIPLLFAAVAPVIQLFIFQEVTKRVRKLNIETNKRLLLRSLNR